MVGVEDCPHHNQKAGWLIGEEGAAGAETAGREEGVNEREEGGKGRGRPRLKMGQGRHVTAGHQSLPTVPVSPPH